MIDSPIGKVMSGKPMRAPENATSIGRETAVDVEQAEAALMDDGPMMR